MTDNQIKLLKEALLEEDLKEMAIIDSLPDEEFVFSEKYKKEMQKLLNKHKKYTHTANRFIPKRLVGVLVAILITLTLMMSISAIREPIIRFIVNTYESFISIFVENDTKTPSKTIEDIILPSYMKEEYTLSDTIRKTTLSTTTWNNAEGHMIELRQCILLDDFKAYIDNQNLNYSLLNTKLNIEIYCVDKNGYLNIMWTDNTYIYSLLCPNTIEITEVEKIIESMEIVED